MPAWVANRFQQNLLSNNERWQRLKVFYGEISQALEAAGLDFVVLKGFSHVPYFVASGCLRTQYDVDLLLPRELVRAAMDVARSLGYQPIEGGDQHPIDHLPTLVLKTGSEWRGNYFDPELPPALELHFRLWDPSTEGFAVPAVEEFWDRRERRIVDDLEFPSLAAIDLEVANRLRLR